MVVDDVVSDVVGVTEVGVGVSFVTGAEAGGVDVTGDPVTGSEVAAGQSPTSQSLSVVL